MLERIEIATEGNDCRECVEKLREPLLKINGVTDVTADAEAELVFVTFDARKIQAAEVHEAILRSGYQPAPVANS